MSNVSIKYLEDENGEIFSPITDTKTLFCDNLSVDNRLRYLGKYAVGYNIAMQNIIFTKPGEGNGWFNIEGLTTNDDTIFSIQDNQIHLTFLDTNYHTINATWFLCVTNDTPEIQTDTWFELSVNKQNINNNINKFPYIYQNNIRLLEDRKNTMVCGRQVGLKVRNGDNITVKFSVYMYSNGTMHLIVPDNSLFSSNSNSQYSTRSELIIEILD